jgi:sigma-B regulation protein RsbU (phosphoserine phosphatase)
MSTLPEVPGLRPGSTKRWRVLLVEDNPGDARLLEVMLADAGNDAFELERADRLRPALERLQGEAFDLVLVDLSLPDSQGMDSFRSIQAQAPRAAIVVLSGLANETMAVEAVHEGAQDYLVKGQVDGTSLVRAMRYAVERKALAEELARHTEELRRRNALLQENLRMAREIQRVFLPPETVLFPPGASAEEAALRFHTLYLPAAELSGDFCNIYPVSETAAGVFICDVMGHGVRAALITAMLRTLVEDLRAAASNPGKFMAEANRSLHSILRRTDVPMLATAFYGVMDVASGDFIFSNAGHPSPVRLDGWTGQPEPLKAFDPRHGPALGLFGDAAYPVCRIPLKANDTVCLFTDGLYEIEGPGQVEFGLDRLLKALRERARLPPAELLRELVAELRRFAPDHEFDDDVCLVAMQVARLRGRE